MRDIRAQIETIANALGGKPNRKNGYRCFCPAHDDRHHPNLDVDPGDGGKVLVHCTAGCSQAEVIEALRARGLWLSGKPLGEAEKQRAVERVTRRKAARRQAQDAAAKKAVEIYSAATEAPEGHPYILAKGGLDFGPHVRRGAWKQRGWTDALIVPLLNAQGSITSLQAISPDGEKDFLLGGKKRGSFYPFGRVKGHTGQVWIAEGLATAAAIHSVGGAPCIMAIDLGNLPVAAEIVRALAPESQICIFGDDDRKEGKEDNPGIQGAIKAAQLVQGMVARPGLGKKADAWDVWHEHGPEALIAAMQAARPVGELQECCHASTPIPLPELPPVEPFEPKLLPEQLCPWIQDIADRLQCPIDYVAVGTMVHLAAVIGRKIGIRPQGKTNWTVVPNLWGLIVGRPGVMKSPALEATSGPLDRLIAEALEDYERSKNEALAAKAASDLRFEARQKEARKLLSQNHDADVSGLLIKDEIEEPTLRRYKTNDTTAASLGEVLRANPNGVLVFRDEMVSLLKGLDREDNADQRGFFLTAWNGDSSYTLDRIGRGLHLHIEACCISLLGGTQPARLSGYIAQAVKGGAGDDGLIQRFGLMVWPDVSPDWQNVDRPPDADAKKKAYEVFGRLDKLDPFSIGAEQDVGFDGDPEGIPYLRFDPDALALFNEWRADLEKKVRSDDLHPALESHFAKYRKLVPALALITHLVDGETGPVTESSTLKALAWAEYLESHARRCYSAVTQEEVRAAREIKKKIANGSLKPPFSSRDVWRPRWAGLDRNAAASGLATLVDYGHLLIKQVETEGRSATLYYVAGGSA
jgi:putative DNA primase/helicase